MIHFFAFLKRNEDGATTIEFTIVTLLFFMLTFGITEFGYLLWQYNSAAKAAQVGSRVAAVSNAVWADLPDLTDDAVSPGGECHSDYALACCRNDTECQSVGVDEVDDPEYDGDAMNCLVFGRQAGEELCKAECDAAAATDEQGMCNYFSRIAKVEAADVVVTYRHT